jgi:hypothetical protein
MTLQHLLNVVVQIANKVGNKKKIHTFDDLQNLIKSLGYLKGFDSLWLHMGLKNTVCGSYLAHHFAHDCFSLRRARLDTEEPSSGAGESRRKKSDASPSTVTNPANKSKKNVDPPKSVQARSTPKGKSPRPNTFSRTDCGRFSVRAARTTSQVHTFFTLKPHFICKLYFTCTFLSVAGVRS